MSQTARSYEAATIRKLDKSRIEISGSIVGDAWERFRAQALKNIGGSTSIDGFRKGMLPENILVAKIGEAAISEEMAELALSKAYLDILTDNKIDAIGKPEIRVTKLARGNPLEFKAVTAVVPEVKLPEYRQLAQKEITKSNPNDEKATDKDIEDTIMRIRRSRASHEGHDHENTTPEEHEKAIQAKLPELTDDFVKSLGDFNDVPDFRNKLSVMVTEEKKDAAREKRRIRIADAISEASTIELPDIMIETELDRTQAQFEADIERMGVKQEDYLKHAKKTMEDLRTEWRPHAEKKAKLQLILSAIAVTENIKLDQKEIEDEVGHIVQHYKDADRERAAVYAETVLTNEKVFQFLEQA